MGTTTNNQAPQTIRVCNLITRITAAGGAERRLLDAIAAPHTQHSVLAGEASPGDNYDRITAVAEVELVASLEREVSPLKDLRGIWTIRSAVSKRAPAIVHTHHSKAGMLTRAALAVMRPSQRPRLVHSLSMASFGAGYGSKASAFFELLEKQSERLVDAYCVVGQDLIDSFAELGVPRSKMYRVRSSQELDRWVATARRREFTESPVRMLFVGSLEERKGVHLLPDVVRQVNTTHPVELTIVGVGGLSEQLTREINAADLPITLLGYRDDIPDLMGQADLLVLPSSAEGLPQVLVQAAANRLPAVSFDVHGTAELVALGADCSVTQDRSAFSMASSVVARLEAGAIDRPADLPLSEWDASSVAQQLRDVYDAVLGDPVLGNPARASASSLALTPLTAKAVGGLVDSHAIDALVVGFPKCGTTSMAQWFDTAEGLSVSNPKETFVLTPEFGRSSVIPRSGPFSGAPLGSTRIEASTLSVYSAELVAAVAVRPDIKVVIAFREPWSALPSWHNQMMNAGLARESDLESNSTREGQPSLGPGFLHCYDSMHRYSIWIETWINALGHDRVLLLHTNELGADRSARQRLEAFLSCQLPAEIPKTNQFHNRRFAGTYNFVRSQPLLKRTIDTLSENAVVDRGVEAAKSALFEQKAAKPVHESRWETALRDDYSRAEELHRENLMVHPPVSQR